MSVSLGLYFQPPGKTRDEAEVVKAFFTLHVFAVFAQGN
jgi:hypothetical protein